jgi:predicted small secreted protein
VQKIFIIVLAASLLSSCASNTPQCVGPQTKNLASAIDAARTSLINGCHAHFDRYYDELLGIAEGDPKPENKRAFSEFLVWSSDQGLLSKRQAQDYYNRYFNVKFMSLKGDYNNCSHTCPNKQKVLFDMERELSDKERGLLRVSLDNEGYYRADQLYQEVELVLEATCTACAASR